ncbi:MAG: DUF4339 domain-containing protein [Flavisolibacter sp.]
MQKVYLLLRNNQQTGPYTVDELLQQQINVHDLVWVEGESFAWSHPTEIKELKNYFDRSLNEKPGGEIIGSSIDDEIEQRAEELRKKISSFKPSHCFPTTFTNDRIYLGTFNSIEEKYPNVSRYQKKEVNAYEWISAALVMLMVAGGVYGGKKYLGAKEQILPEAAVRAVSFDHHAAKSAKPAVHIVTYKEPGADSTFTDTAALVIATPERKKPVIKPTKASAAKASLATIMKEVKAPVKDEEVLVPLIETPHLEQPKAAAPQPKIIAEEPTEKKKGIFRGLFKKKKKNDDQTTSSEAASLQSQDN